ncbi:hypothetical protein ABZS76_32645 [Streptomyces sp. NPDC005562]|uniref:hypothetical protein n=1 Tax=Streptomyces sp. NPDC005562 TaxID=3154890 RepID=UPI0033A5F951
MTPGGVPTNHGVITNVWVQVAGTYYYCRGATADGKPRLAELSRPPFGKTVHVYDGATATWSTRRLPFRLQPGAIFFLILAAFTAVLVPLMLSGQDPILAKAATPVAVAVLLLVALLAQTAHLTPHDEISAREAQQANYEAYVASQQHAAEQAAHRQAQGFQALQGWAAAQWAQQAQINATLNPGQDTFRPYGQSPPL